MKNKTEKYKKQIVEILKKYPSIRQAKVFLFGSFLHEKKFFDIDIGIIGNVDKATLALVREEFEESNFPYKVDIIDFRKVEEKFKNYVLSGKILWLKF